MYFKINSFLIIIYFFSLITHNFRLLFLMYMIVHLMKINNYSPNIHF